ncbi:MAG TPA: hypothetical protein GX696_06405, partial [Pseudomonadaceae bacterium]|nr:hypothetical protein [Pseudomonadaceae bacterium]
TVEQSSLIQNLDQLEAQRTAQPVGDLPQAPVEASGSDLPTAAGSADSEIEAAAGAALDAAESAAADAANNSDAQ